MTTTTAPAARDTSEVKAARRETLRALLRSPTFIVGTLIVLWWAVCAIFGTLFAPYDYLAPSPDTLQSPSSAHWFGTDQLGRDVLSRVIVGARSIIVVALLATILGTVLGTAFGLVMGYFRGFVDETLSRIVDAFLAIPLIVLAILVITALGPSSWTVIVVIGVVFAPIIARTVRSTVLSERELDYVSAARLRGERAPHVMFAEILPNVLPPIIVEFTVRLGYAVFSVATLSFLGFGIQPPSPDWGLQIAENYGLISGNIWWPTLFPAFAIASLAVAVNLVADGIQAVLDR